MKLRAPGKSILLPPVRPNVGVEVAYQRRLNVMVEAMNKSVLWWVSAAYRERSPEMALDVSPADFLAKVMTKLARRWVRQFSDAADKMAEQFASENKRAYDVSMMSHLKAAGFAVKFQGTAMTRDAFDSVVAENVSLIKSIPSKSFTEIEGAVMRSVQAGRDLKTLQTELLALGSKTKKRAALIARDQNNKATAAMHKARRLSLGLTQAKWRHSRGGVHPRPSHVEATGQLYEIAQGCYIDEEYIMPGEKINCKCVDETLIPGFED